MSVTSIIQTSMQILPTYSAFSPLTRQYPTPISKWRFKPSAYPVVWPQCGNHVSRSFFWNIQRYPQLAHRGFVISSFLMLSRYAVSDCQSGLFHTIPVPSAPCPDGAQGSARWLHCCRYAGLCDQVKHSEVRLSLCRKVRTDVLKTHRNPHCRYPQNEKKTERGIKAS